LFVGALLPLIPIGPGSEVGKDKPFAVILQFETANSGYAFDPSAVKLFYSEGDYSPDKMQGPFTQINRTQEIARASPGHDWECMDTHKSREIRGPMGLIPSKSCFFLEFPIGTLSPAQGFQVEVRGLSNQGVETKLPRFVSVLDTGQECRSWETNKRLEKDLRPARCARTRWLFSLCV
jgi:hypothetical protein